jgi:hypothetical protein
MDRNKTIVISLLVVLVATGVAVFWFSSQKKIFAPIKHYTLAESRPIAETWLKNNPKILEKAVVRPGADQNFKLISEQTIAEDTFEFIFERENANIAFPVRNVIIRVERGEVKSAIVDKIFDEVRGVPVAVLDGGKVIEGAMVDIYFVKKEDGADKVVPVKRPIYMPVPSPRAALDLLLSGPNPNEEKEGYFTFVKGVDLLKSFEVRDGLATVNFTSAVRKKVKPGSTEAALVTEQIKKTLQQFKEIKDIVINF